MSTLLSDLDTAPTSSDGDLVQRIFSEMNGGNTGGAPPPPQPSSMPPPAPMTNAPNPNSTVHMTMDSAPATAHVIGGSHPTPADFAAAMHSMQGSAQAAAAPPQVAAPKPYPGEARRAAPPFRNRILEEIRTPLLVTILVFVFSLPVIHVIFAHYLPSMVRSTGDLTTVGLLMKSLIAGGLFWFLQRVIVPLLNL